MDIGPTLIVGASCGIMVGITAALFIKVLVNNIDPDQIINRTWLNIVCVSIGMILVIGVLARFVELDLRIAYLVLSGGLIVQTIVDAYTHRLVRIVSYTMAAVGVVLLSGNAVRHTKLNTIISAAICSFAGLAIFLVANKLSSQGVGTGDIRLVGVLGWYLGFLGYEQAIFGLFLACGLASIVGIGLVIFQRQSIKLRMAFGPYLAIGALGSIFFNTDFRP